MLEDVLRQDCIDRLERRKQAPPVVNQKEIERGPIGAQPRGAAFSKVIPGANDEFDRLSLVLFGTDKPTKLPLRSRDVVCALPCNTGSNCCGQARG